TIIPSLLGFIYKNADTYPEMGIFEIGRVADGLKEDGLANERKRLGLVMASKKMSEKEVYFKIKEIIEQLLLTAKNTVPSFTAKDTEGKSNYIHPVNCTSILLEGSEIGYFSVLNPRIRNNIDKKLNVVFAEIDLERMEQTAAEPLNYKEVSKYPGVTVDLSLLADKTMRYEAIEEAIQGYPCEYLQGYHLIDIFEDEKLLPDKKSITIRFEFGSMDRTLEGQETNAMVEGLLQTLKEKGLELR
ncbi:MAG TPA: hypothetical protein DDY59_09040, partial [Lachnospiraceae bacterium]|nr:hypothetical protein [Lachnospiraceae bacterium]